MSNLNKTISNYLDNAVHGESEAVNLFHYLGERFGWVGTFMTRADIEDRIEREISDEEFERITGTSEWRDLFANDYVMGALWGGIDDAVTAAGIEEEEADVARPFKVREMEDRAYEATCPNSNCKNHGVSFVRDDLFQGDDDEAVCPDCETPLMFQERGDDVSELT